MEQLLNRERLLSNDVISLPVPLMPCTLTTMDPMPTHLSSFISVSTILSPPQRTRPNNYHAICYLVKWSSAIVSPRRMFHVHLHNDIIITTIGMATQSQTNSMVTAGFSRLKQTKPCPTFTPFVLGEGGGVIFYI